eukprot:TRINITY_DN2223_c1_g2_i1.p1 TRINITY_DN2223_c1_g2~~TRINITY_DN2223_c1_g2_i1.p1  ORF type:complete len:746 (-),score=107.45 TRINITY_DN2223_c1_g2_i1:48-2285(-)
MQEFLISDDAPVGKSESSLLTMCLTEWATFDKTTLPDQLPIFGVDDDQSIDSIIRQPNSIDGDVQNILNVANMKDNVGAWFFCYGWLVQAGEIMILQNNGRTQVVGPGRYRIPYIYKPFCKWGGRYSLTKNYINEGTLTLVRVCRGQLGLATENGKPVLLAEGYHVYNSPLFKFEKFQPWNADYIHHMSIHVIRVPKGRFAKIWEQARPKLLPEGLHAIDNPVFSYEGTVDSKDPCIQHGSVCILQVPKGGLGLIKESNFPRLLEEGLHIYDSPTLQYNGVQSKLSPIIMHGTISRFRICKGELGLAWRDNDPLLIDEPGTYQVDSANFKFEKVVDATIKDIRLGSRKIITVYSGEVGVSFAAGRLQILPPGRHVIEAADHTFDDFLSTQQRAMRLVSTTQGGKKEEDLLVCDTKDLVKIGIRADVFYKITDPEKAIMSVGREGLESLVMETSIATLTNILRSTSLNDIATSSMQSAVSVAANAEEAVKAQALGQASAVLFFDKAHDQFLAKLHDDFQARYGIEITNIRIEQFKIMDYELANSISQQAINTAQTENQLANLEGQTQIATQEQEREKRVAQIQSETIANQRRIEAESQIIQAEAEGRAQQVRAEAEANQVRIRAEADASAIKIRAQATIAEAEAAASSTKIKADASVSEAKARAEGIRLKACAEADRAKQLADTPLGERLALLDIYSGVVKASNSGVEKVVYVDPATTSANNPFALLTLQSLNRDLAALGSGSEPA